MEQRPRRASVCSLRSSLQARTTCGKVLFWWSRQRENESEMIHELKLTNYRSYGEAELALHPLTLLVGPAAAGKSNLFKASSRPTGEPVR